MKKLVCIMVAALCLAMIAGCGASGEGVLVDPNAPAAGTEDVKTPDDVAEPGEPVLESGALYFESNGARINMYDKAGDALNRLGTPKGTFEAPSCAYQGVDKFYYYNGFEMTVNQVDGGEHVTVLMVVDDTVAIPQGVTIGSTKEAMLKSMGDGYTVSGNLYLFTEQTTKLQIEVKDGYVASIMYAYAPKP